ncbi:hypothetical protein Tco_0507833 [Tanacetum coccineum]
MRGISLSRECHPSRKTSFSKMSNITSGMIPFYSRSMRIKSFDGVCMGKKLLISSKLVMKDPPGAIIVPISPVENYRLPPLNKWSSGGVQSRFETYSGKDGWRKPCLMVRHANFDLKTAGDHQKLQLNELNELHDQAYENSLIYKEKTKKLHDSKIKNRIFNVGDRVLLFNSRLKIFSRKLKTRWSQGLSPSPKFFHTEPLSYLNPAVLTIK